MNLRKNFRIWWQKPRVASDFSQEREVSFLELFYDLVYVVVIAEVAHHLTYHLSWSGLAEFSLMMVFVMWAWLNGMFYHSLHGSNDVSMRVFTFMQMILVGGMVVFIGDMFTDGAAGFAVVFALFQLLFAGLWFRTGYHDPGHRSVANSYSYIYILSALAMFWSATLTNAQTVQVLSAVIGINMLLPFMTYFRKKTRKAAVAATKATGDSVERIGLITIIALGEVVVSSINGVNDLESVTPRAVIVGTLGMLIAIGIWWLYFDFISRRLPKKGFWNNQLFPLLHIPLIAAIAATGGVLRDMISHNDAALEPTTRWLFVLSVSAGILTVAILLRLIKQPSAAIQKYTRKGISTIVVSALIILALGLTSFGHIALLASVFVALLAPVLYGIRIWIRAQR